MSKCDKLVRKLKTQSGYKVYASAVAAKKAGAKVCGGEIRADAQYESHWASSNGWNGEGRSVSSFDGIDFVCVKCRDVVKHYSIDDLEQLVTKDNS